MAKQKKERVIKEAFSLAGLKFRFANRGGQLRVLSIAPPGAEMGPDVEGGPLWERTPVLMHIRGRDRMGHFGARSIHTQPSMALMLRKIAREGTPATGAIVAELYEEESGLEVTLRYQACSAPGAVRVSAEARNAGTKPFTLEQFLLCLPGLGRSDNQQWSSTAVIHAANNTWFGEAQWNTLTPSQAAIADTRPPFGDTLGVAVWRNIGTWATTNYLPMGVLEDKDTGLSFAWQIEHSASWQMELGRLGNAFYLAGGGPTARYGDWFVTLQPGQSCSAVPIGFTCTQGGFEQAIATLQGYRRKGCKPFSAPDSHLPVFFNDYMNCLNGNPTEENEPPLIDAAAAAGAEYYVIDAGWFDPKQETWGFGLGDWEESPDRFGATGLKGICDLIRAKGMKVGLWAEIECVTQNAKASKKPDSWFICANGHRVVSGGRMFWNFTNPEVRAHCHAAFDRLVRDFGMAYVKLDYNADAGIGDNQSTPSLGAGQVAHTRAFHTWLDEVRVKHPNLIVENCGSGGMRLDYGMLSHTHVQSTSDQQDYKLYPSIMAGVLAAGLPEQMCIWSYPQPEFSDEANALNLVSPMLARWHLSGRLDKMSPKQIALVRQATDLWKARVRKFTPTMTPFWPTPLRHLHEQQCWLAAGLRDAKGTHAFLSVYRLDSADKSVTLSLDSLNLAGAKAEMLFPTTLGGKVKLDTRKKTLTVELPSRYSARLIEIVAKHN